MISKTEKETFAAGAVLAEKLKGNETVYLFGDVGAGKTVFAKGLAAGLNITETITSPTYTYFNIYESGRFPLYHFDLYRVKCAEDIVDLGIAEYLNAEGVKVVEWPEILGENPAAVKVAITKKGSGRVMIIENNK